MRVIVRKFWGGSKACLAGLIVVSGCSHAPTMSELSANVTSVDRTKGSFRAASLQTSDMPSEWWAGFGDPQLVALVERALTVNAGLDAADASVAETQALARRAGLNLTPSSRSTAAITNSEAPDSTGSAETDGAVSLSASWELDFFGRNRALLKAARGDLEAEKQLRRDTAVIIASETALAYVDLRGAQVRLAVAQKNAASQKQGLDLIETLFSNGRATELDYERASSQYRTTLASVPVFEADIENAISRLAALTRQSASNPEPALSSLASQVADIPALVGPLSAGNPAELLRRRPDIRRAEAQLASRLALSAAARADIFPTISFGASVSGSFADTDALSQSQSYGFAFGPSLVWAGPDLRRVYAAIDVADARSQQLAATYEQTVLNALRDTEVALTNYSKELQRREDLVASEKSARRALELATLRFQEGLDSYLDVLDAQRTLLATEDRLATSRLETSRRAITAYRNLGGIWSDDALSAYRQNAQSGD